MHPTKIALIALSFIPLAACDALNPKSSEPPKVGSITRNLRMIDSDGTMYGTVELDPINGGKIMDAQGRIIGRVVSPPPVTVAPTVPMPANGY